MSSIKLTALLDCNNFFVSCERVFKPQLARAPVVVLSNNDGCIISRSQEAKDLGIPMGAPYFQWKDFFERQHVQVFSSNFSLYGDMSHRVMQILASFTDELEIYSIDEAFFSLKEKADPLAFCQQIRNLILQWTGLPVCIGIAPTKTLAKVANHIAKKNPSFGGTFALIDEETREKVLCSLPVQEVWGIGKRKSLHLARHGIFTAGQLKKQEDSWIKSHLSVVGLRTVWELRGTVCLGIEEEIPPRQSVMTSRSFGRDVVKKEELLEALATFASRGGEKLRKQKSLAYILQIFIIARSSDKENSFLGNQATWVFREPTDYTPDFIEAAEKALETIFRPDYRYKKAGVLLANLVPSSSFQPDFFSKKGEEEREKKRRALDAFDRVNGKFGYPILQFAAQGIEKGWKGLSEKQQPCFTTQWDELLTITI